MWDIFANYMESNILIFSQKWWCGYTHSYLPPNFNAVLCFKFYLLSAQKQLE